MKNDHSTNNESQDSDRDRSDLEEQTYLRLSTFTRTQWVRWIGSVLNEEPIDPPVRIGRQELQHVLAQVYLRLNTKSQRDRFAEAVLRLLESTPQIQSNAKHLYYLIDLTSLVRPVRGKRLLRRYLREGSLLGMDFGLQNLHQMLLVAASKYDIDQGLVDIIQRSSKEIKDYTYSIVCVRILSLRDNPKDYLDFLEKQVLPQVDSKLKASKLARQLKGIFGRHGYGDFCNWYSSTALKVPPGQKDAFELFEAALRDVNIPKFHHPTLQQDDPHEALIAAQLYSYDPSDQFSAKALFDLASLQQTAGEDTTIAALVNIWRRRVPFAKEGKAWWYVSASPDSPWARSGGDPDLALIITNADEKSEQRVEFSMSVNPSLAYVFERVKSICEGRVIFEKIAVDFSDVPKVRAHAVTAESLHPALDKILQMPT